MLIDYNKETKRWELKDFVTGAVIKDFRTREEARIFKRSQIKLDEGENI